MAAAIMCYRLKVVNGVLQRNAQHTNPDLVCHSKDEAIRQLKAGYDVFWSAAPTKAPIINEIEAAVTKPQGAQ